MSGRGLPYGLAEVGVGAVPVVKTVGEADTLPDTSGVEATGSSGEEVVDCDCSGEEVTKVSLGRLRGDVVDSTGEVAVMGLLNVGGAAS